ncbi:unnamed protein product, partial [Rotaria sp. Silwood1]
MHDDPTKTVTGIEAIAKRIEELSLKQHHVKIRQVDCHLTVDLSIVIQVCGEISSTPVTDTQTQPIMKCFVQTFVLTPTDNSKQKYYVHNDIFRYLDSPTTILTNDNNTKISTTTTNNNEVSNELKFMFIGLIDQLKNAKYHPILVSLQPQQIQFDILGFAFEATPTARPTIQSPNIMPVNSTSSHTNIKEFIANTIICGEVTTSNLTFNNDELLKLEQANFDSSNETTQATHRLLHKMLQLERCVAFILQYYQNIELQNLLVVLC